MPVRPRAPTRAHLHQAAHTLHAGAIVGLLSHRDPDVRYAAVVTLRHLDKAALTMHAGAIVNVLADSDDECAAWLW